MPSLYRILATALFGLLLTLPAAAQIDLPDEIIVALDALSAELELEEPLTLQDLQAYDFERVNFPDASLNCPQEDELYAQALTVGFTFLLTIDDMTYDYRIAEGVTEPEQAVLCTTTEIDTDAEEAPPTVATETFTMTGPVIAVAPLPGEAGPRLIIVANGLPASATLNVGVGPAGADAVTVGVAQADVAGSLASEIAVPQAMLLFENVTVVLSTSDGAFSITSVPVNLGPVRDVG